MVLAPCFLEYSPSMFHFHTTVLFTYYMYFFLYTIPNNSIWENSLQLSGYGIGFWCTRSLVRILHGHLISDMHLFICFFVTDFVRKTLSNILRNILPQNHLFPNVFKEHGSLLGVGSRLLVR